MKGKGTREAYGRDSTIAKNLIHAIVLVGVAFLMIIIVYGVDAVIPGIHDLFHDFRHSAGFLCH